ncbi:C_GCAxxG_C_C family protein [Candidatus Bathyarchaeota archaeon]|jgi:C_GCAxxG_C_C family probable redox protein|nr:MAG: C_GCAxxG_C_C family protein [Candidatus Bathyarchaeota archaeon]
MNREESVQRSMRYVDEGFLCVEAVLKTLADLKGIESEYIPAIASGMAAGVARTSQICGAVSGAIMGLGLWFGRSSPVVSDRKSYWYGRLFIDRWMESHPSTNCSALLGIDLDKPEGIAEFGKENMWENKCKRYIREAVGLAYDILVEEGVYSVGA